MLKHPSTIEWTHVSPNIIYNIERDDTSTRARVNFQSRLVQRILDLAATGVVEACPLDATLPIYTAERRELIAVVMKGLRPTGPAIASRMELVTKEEYVTRRLREMVISGELPPGARLRQQQLASDLGVSATPVREALRRLVSEGYLRSEPHIGVAVAHPVAEWTLEVFEIRQNLEGKLAAEASQNMTAERIGLLHDLNRDFSEACAKHDYLAARLLNYRFHHLIWESANQPVTLEIVNSLWAKFPMDNLGNVEGRGERSVAEHEHLMKCIESRDAREAGRAAYVHIGGGRQDYLRLMDTKTRR